MFIGLLSACAIGSFGKSLVSNLKRFTKCVSLNNQPCKARPTIVNIYSHKTLFYQFTVSVNKCVGSCNTFDDPYARAFVPNKVKIMNVTVFNLVSGVNETRCLVQHEPCECKCVLNERVCNSKQNWNHNECRCECKELDGWSSCKDDYMWNPSTCDCECNKACKIDEYLDIENCLCKKHLIDKLVLECEDEILDTTETSLDDKKETCENNCLIHTISSVIICLLLIVVICVSCYFYYARD